jgi:hypothetical protein
VQPCLQSFILLNYGKFAIVYFIRLHLLEIIFSSVFPIPCLSFSFLLLFSSVYEVYSICVNTSRYTTLEQAYVECQCNHSLKIRVQQTIHIFFIYLFIYLLQIYNLFYNRAISKYVIRKHLCGAIIQWWFSYVYCTLCCACVYSSSSLWSFKSEGHCRFSLRLTFNGLLNSVT